ATIGFFPVDQESVNYLRATGRTEEQCLAFEKYFRAQNMFDMPRKGEIDYSVDIDLNLADVQPSVAGPKRPQDRINLPDRRTKIPRNLSKTGARRRLRKETSRSPRKACCGIERQRTARPSDVFYRYQGRSGNHPR